MTQIFFQTIAASTRKPLVRAEFDTTQANRALGANRQPTVVIAPKLATGTQAAGVPVAVYSDSDADTYAGKGSIAAEMVRHLLKTNPRVTLSLVLVNDPAGAAAAGTVTYAASVTKSGTEWLWVGDTYYEIAGTTGDTAASVATAMAAKVNADLNAVVTASVAAGVLTITCRHKGLLGNQIGIAAGGTSTGLTRTTVAMTGGTLAHVVDPALTGIYAAGDKIIASAFNDTTALTAIRNHCNSVSDSTEIRGCRAWFATTGSVAAASTLASALNSWVMHGALLRYNQTAGGRSSSWAIAAAMAAVDAWEEDPAMPLNTLPLLTIAVPDKVDVLGRSEQEALLYAGVTPIEPGVGNMVQIVRAITTYTKSAAGGDDPALLDITTPKTLFYFREQVTNDQKVRFGRGKFTTRRAKAVMQRAYEIATKLEELEMLQNVEAYKKQFIWEPNAQNANMMNLRIPSPIVPGLHIIASQFVLYIESPAGGGI